MMFAILAIAGCAIMFFGYDASVSKRNEYAKHDSDISVS